MRRDVAKRNTEYIGYSTPNKAALALMEEEWTADETYNPPQDVIDRCEAYEDLGDYLEVYDQTWWRIKAS